MQPLRTAGHDYDESTIVDVTTANVDVATQEAKAFHKELNFSAVHTLSSDDPVLNALAQLRIGVPFHSIIGQHAPGPIEDGSDGVVPYASSHLDGASSELVVRSGHGVCENRNAQGEIVRILRLELQHEIGVARR